MMNKRKPSTRKVHPLPGGNTAHVSGGIGANYKEPGYVGLPHFLMGSMPSHGKNFNPSISLPISFQRCFAGSVPAF